MKFLFFLSFICFVSHIKAQTSFIPKLPRNISSPAIVDSGNIKITYFVNKFRKETKYPYRNKIESIWFDCDICVEDIHLLEIGKKVSKYYSYNVFMGDSIFTDFIIKNPNAATAPNRNGTNPTVTNNYFWSELYKDYAKNTLTEYAWMPRLIPDCYYQEDIPDFVWKIQEDTLTVAGYLCQKATCTFRGFNYIAWFALSIPISNGPWKFGGLPGLILKVHDDRNKHVFECSGIEVNKNGFAITANNHSNYKKVKREKLMELWKDIFDHYFQIAGFKTESGAPYSPAKKYLIIL